MLAACRTLGWAFFEKPLLLLELCSQQNWWLDFPSGIRFSSHKITLYQKVAVSCLKISKTSFVHFVSWVCTLVSVILSDLAGYLHDATALGHNLESI